MPFRKLSDLQILYYSNLLNLKRPKWEVDSSRDILVTAKVDPIPHQVEAAQFAFRNPFSGGVILGDEVGLGKTIETGLILSQLWAEGKRRFLIIAPKSLRHQWQDELRELFYLESDIIDTNLYRKVLKGTYPDPLEDNECILITNEHFVAKYVDKVQQSNFDVVVIDEAHKLRNVWKEGKSQAKRAKAIREAITPFKKLLLTATPMQNNLMELYGLTTFLDPYLLGTAESFKRNYLAVAEEELEEKLAELKYRMQTFFKRELRKNVQVFIPYTNRNAVTIPFDPTDPEEELRTTFEDYLKNPNTVALPPIANGFLRLVYFKLLASSSFALKNSLNNLYIRLVFWSVALDDEQLYSQLYDQIQAVLTLPDGTETNELEHFKKLLFKNCTSQDFIGLKEKVINDDSFKDLLESEEVDENYDDNDLEEVESIKIDPEEKKSQIISEGELILHLIELSRTLTENSKGTALIHALENQFKRARENNWPEKAVIFTEFKTTQNYVINVLEQFGMNREKDIVIFNGDSGSAEERRQLVEDFRGEKKIFLTTEAGAEGLNLQFCNLLINYDLPWNPQRIEQRIGRCHRYGQKLDVVVVNFANKKNVADQRILELLDSKFKLFEGAFGASNTVLGNIESGTDIEKEILKIYLTCRDEKEIEQRFDELIETSSEAREDKFKKAQEIILEEFDEEVQSKLKSLGDKIGTDITETEALVRDIVLSSLEDKVTYKDEQLEPLNDLDYLDQGKTYTFSRKEINSSFIGPHHPIIKEHMNYENNSFEISFKFSGNHNISILEKYVNSKGSFKLIKVKFTGVETKEVLFPMFVTSENEVLTLEEGRKLLAVTNESRETNNINEISYDDHLNEWIKSEKEILDEYNEVLYNEEIEKLDGYFEDLQELKRRETKDIEKEIDKLKKERRKLKLDQARGLNVQINKLKKLIIKKEEEITQLRRENTDKEKDRIKELNDLSEISYEVSILALGEFEIL